MTNLNEKYIGKPACAVLKELQNSGLKVIKICTLGKKDNGILNDERVVSVREENDEIKLITSFFKTVLN